MKKVAIMSSLALLAAVVAPANAVNFVSNGDFSAGLTGWTYWQERGNPDVTTPGGVLTVSDANSDYNGGVYQHVTVPIGQPLHLNGFWGVTNPQGAADFAEVLIFDGHLTLAQMQALTDAGLGAGTDNNFNNGELIYKNDTWATPGGWGGPMSTTSPVRNVGNPMPDQAPPSGLLTVVLKLGSGGGHQPTYELDEITLTPEPGTIALFAIPALALLRRRRGA